MINKFENIDPTIKSHFESNMLDGDDLYGSMLRDSFVLEYINEFYILKPNQGSETTQQ